MSDSKAHVDALHREIERVEDATGAINNLIGLRWVVEPCLELKEFLTELLAIWHRVHTLLFLSPLLLQLFLAIL